jgi:hypothetical protein
MHKKTIPIEVDSKFAIKYFITSKTGMRFSENQGFGMTLNDAIKLRSKLETKLPNGSPYTIYRNVSTYQKIDVWSELITKMDTIVSAFYHSE